MCLHATLWAYCSRQLEVGEVTWNPFYFYPGENARARTLEQLETDGVTALHPLTNICHQCGTSAKGCSESKVMGDWSLVKFRSYSQGLISLQMLPERRWGTENQNHFFICYWVLLWGCDVSCRIVGIQEPGLGIAELLSSLRFFHCGVKPCWSRSIFVVSSSD